MFDSKIMAVIHYGRSFNTIIRRGIPKFISIYTPKNVIEAVSKNESNYFLSNGNLKSYFSTSSFLLNTSSDSSAIIAENPDEQEVLYRAIDILIKGHEKPVLESYITFMKSAAEHLDITVDGVLHPKFIADRMTLLKSKHIYKKHRVQYEMRTHREVLQLKYLTGSTAKVYLEYIQRNIPAGVAMHVHKWEINRIPEHIRQEMVKNMENMTEEDWKKESENLAKLQGEKRTVAKDYQEFDTTKRFLVGIVM
ncbi:small ribosomal subunit protein uS10m-like [Clavelina lepadiformis]|uniref:Small ribosomal subunit protein uS10m n=1 Tax=Clavelina lepadiformis TaxID=159417 RepID=A0ABP0FW82_CLALP